jgi:hypothetical protein
VRALIVVVVTILAENSPQVTFRSDQHPIQAVGFKKSIDLEAGPGVLRDPRQGRAWPSPKPAGATVVPERWMGGSIAIGITPQDSHRREASSAVRSLRRRNNSRSGPSSRSELAPTDVETDVS